MLEYFGQGVIEFVILSQFVSACGCMRRCLGLGLRVRVRVRERCFDVVFLL